MSVPDTEDHRDSRGHREKCSDSFCAWNEIHRLLLQTGYARAAQFLCVLVFLCVFCVRIRIPRTQLSQNRAYSASTVSSRW